MAQIIAHTRPRGAEGEEMRAFRNYEDNTFSTIYDGPSEREMRRKIAAEIGKKTLRGLRQIPTESGFLLSLGEDDENIEVRW